MLISAQVELFVEYSILLTPDKESVPVTFTVTSLFVHSPLTPLSSIASTFGFVVSSLTTNALLDASVFSLALTALARIVALAV